jgi:hypothetical protein
VRPGPSGGPRLVGPADDPLVHITPEDIDGAIVARGGYKGNGDATISGSGWGLVKFIWRHGEESNKPPAMQVSRDDLMSFPDVIRDDEPTREATPAGQGREWRVNLPGPDGEPRTVVFVDNRLTGRGDVPHLVSTYVQDPGEPGFDAPLSTPKGPTPESPGRAVGGPAEDTAAGAFAHDQQGRGAANIGPVADYRNASDAARAVVEDAKASDPAAEAPLKAADEVAAPPTAIAVDAALDRKGPENLVPGLVPGRHAASTWMGGWSRSRWRLRRFLERKGLLPPIAFATDIQR